MAWDTEYTPTGETLTEIRVWATDMQDMLTLPNDLEKFNREADDRMKCAVWMALQQLETARVEADPRVKGFERKRAKIRYYEFRQKGKLTHQKRGEFFMTADEKLPEGRNSRGARRRIVVDAIRAEKMKHYTPGIGQRVTYGVGNY